MIWLGGKFPETIPTTLLVLAAVIITMVMCSFLVSGVGK